MFAAVDSCYLQHNVCLNTQNEPDEPETSPLKPKSIAYIKQYKAWISRQKVCVFTHVKNQWRKRMGGRRGQWSVLKK